jgi:soluble lytic murein transglycosylase-like protein
MNLLKKISKEELLIGAAVFVVVYYFFSKNSNKTTKKESEKLFRLSDPDFKLRDWKMTDAQLTAKFKNIAGPSYNKFIEDVKAIPMEPIVAIRQLYTESSFSPDVISCKRVSSAGAKGIAQFMPGTWPSYGKGSPCNVSDSLEAYPKIMKELVNKFPGRLDLALAGYNWGPNRTILKNALANNTPFIDLKPNIPKETYGYATSILRPKND